MHLTLDLDERLTGAENLRDLAGLFAEKPEVSSMLAIVSDPALMNQQTWRATFLRAPICWMGRTMEGPQCPGEEMLWTHRVGIEHKRSVHHGRRDLDIALDWADDEPDAWLPLLAAADEAAELEGWTVVAERCDLGLEHTSVPDQQRAALFLLRAQAADALGDRESVERLVYQSVRCSPAAESWLLAGRYALDRSTFEEALSYARVAVEVATTEQVMQQAVSLAANVAVKRDGNPRAGVEQRRKCALWPQSTVLTSTW